MFVETLVAAGVTRVWGVVGDSLNGLTEVIRKTEGIEWRHVRNEEAGAFAAGAEGQVTGKLAVCAGSCGPGNLHLINGLYDCHRSRVPVLAIAAQIPSAEVGSGYFQETKPDHLFKDCSHYCEVVSQPEQMPRVLEIAMRTAVARKGVAVVVVSGDVALRDCPGEVSAGLGLHRDASRVVPPTGALEEAAELLNASRKVVILGGAGCAGAHQEVMKVAGLLKAPIVHAMRGKEYLEPDNPFDVGMTGLLGFSSGYHAMMGCDALLMLGTDFPYRQFFPEKVPIVQVDVRGEQIGRRAPVRVGLVGGVRETLEELAPLLEVKDDRSYLDRALEHYAKTREDLDALATGEPGRKPIHPQYVARLLNEICAEDAIFTCDVGTPTIWAARYLRMNGKRRLLGSFIHGSMANALPQAIGAQAAVGGRQVVSLSGDGGLAMLLGDLLTLKQWEMPVKVVVFNNGSLGFVELEMRAAGLLDYGTELVNPDFARLAESAGIMGVRVESPEELVPAIERGVAHPGPCVLDVVVNRQELAMPPTITASQAMGFGLFALKALISGRGDQVVDLARTNLFAR